MPDQKMTRRAWTSWKKKASNQFTVIILTVDWQTLTFWEFLLSAAIQMCKKADPKK